jgi:hypothetical protein
MITVDDLRKCAWLNSMSLEELLRKNYPEDTVLNSEFLGISNGGQFVYKIAYPDPDTESGLAVGKVFVWQGSNGEILADY